MSERAHYRLQPEKFQRLLEKRRRRFSARYHALQFNPACKFKRAELVKAFLRKKWAKKDGTTRVRQYSFRVMTAEDSRSFISSIIAICEMNESFIF